MQQYTNERTDEIINSRSQPPFTLHEIAAFDESTQQEVLNLTTRLAICPVNPIIISGAGKAPVVQGVSAALVGSMFENTDEIISTPQSSNKLLFREGDTLPNGSLTMPGSKH